MKKILFILAMFAVTSVSAIDRFVDPNLGSGNGTTLFTTVTSAVNAAVNGDRILIVAGTYNEPTLTLNKSLVIIPQVAGTYVNYNGNITIAGFPGMNLSILGFRLGIYSVTANAITSGSATNRATINIIDSRMTDISLDQDFYDLTAVRCSNSGIAIFRYGNFICSKVSDLYVKDEVNQLSLDGKITIINDTILNRFEFRNDNHRCLVANNLLSSLIFFKWNYSQSVSNSIRNNQFTSGATIFFPGGVPSYNIEIVSNEFIGAPVYFNGSYCGGGGYDGGDGWCGFYWNGGTASFPDPNSPGFFKWTYNGIDLPCTIPTGSQPLVLTKITGLTGTNINAGNPNHDYYDIDLTINDRGRTGGPYSILNYNPIFNPSNGKAYVFDLEIPADLFPGQQIDIKAKGYHRN